MTSMPASRPHCDESAEPERISLAHGLTALIYRYSDGEPRPRRKLLLPTSTDEEQRLAVYEDWLAEQRDRDNGGGVA